MKFFNLRNRLILVFLAATLAPLLMTLWISVSLLDRSLALSSSRKLDEMSRALETTGREVYRQAREALKDDADNGRMLPLRLSTATRERWPAAQLEFWESGQPERFLLSGDAGDEIQYLVRRDAELLVYTASLHGVQMQRLSSLYAGARATVEGESRRDLRRGFNGTLIFLAAAIWAASFGALVYWAHRISHPIRQLTAGLSQVAGGNLEYRLVPARGDEIGTAMSAFNNMAEQLHQSRDRLVYMTRLESWQALARKTAHEIKNSLTPIRLTMEEVAVRYDGAAREFLQQAAQIVVDEVVSLERRVSAFSEFASEPPVCPKIIDVNAMLEERIAFLKAAHPEVTYNLRLATERPRAFADEDLLKGVLTNLLENAAQAVETGGVVLGVTTATSDGVGIEVHDSGPGLSPLARGSLFEPTISFKKGGMGLGLSIARKSALLSGGDIVPVNGELGGAAFRVVLPLSPAA